MEKYILSVDQGTTGTTAMLTSIKTMLPVDKVNMEFPQNFPNPGWVEHNLHDIWSSVKQSVKKVIEKNNLRPEQIVRIGITNQRETTCAYDRSGRPLHNAIVWQDRRTSKFCQENKEAYSQFQKKTGLPLDPYFSATKMKWLVENSEQVKEAYNDKNLLLSTIDTFLLYKMSSGNSFSTEPSNASRTLLMNLSTCQWDDELLKFFNIDKNCLPEIQDSFTEFGKTKNLDFLPDGIPIACILGDQQAALFGQTGFEPGDLKCTYGTGAFILLNTGDEQIVSKQGLLTTVAYRHNGKACYALEGSSYIAGAAVQWLRDNLELIHTSSQVEDLSKKAQENSDMEELIFFPFFTGIGSPYWEPDAKGAILGLSRGTEKKHIARACLEGMALSINDSINALISDSPTKVDAINVDGGACANNLLMQMQADFSKKEIIRPVVIETTAYGVALGAQVGCEEIKFSGLKELWKKDKTFNPSERPYIEKKLTLWKNLIKKVFL